MKSLKYITEFCGESFEIEPNWNCVAILSQSNGIRKYQDSLWELQPRVAFMFDNVEVCENFIANFNKIIDSYNEIIPEGAIYYIVHDLTNLKEINYADRLVSRKPFFI
jgi:hypothetical protein